MKKFLMIIAFLSTFIAGYAVAQSTALPIVLGFLSTTECTGSFKSCWIPYSLSHPMPVLSN